MLTQIEVARRLGKSVATVRRLEGTLLHPHRDTVGVNRFDPKEIECLVAAKSDSTNAGAHRSTWFRNRKDLCKRANHGRDSDKLDGGCRSAADALNEAQSLNDRVLALEQELRRRDRLDATRAAQTRRDNGVLVETVVGLLDALSDRELQRLGDDDLASVVSVLDKLCAEQ
jgi:hypothetical protein